MWHPIMCHILLIRSQSQHPAHPPKRAVTHGHEHWEARTSENCLIAICHEFWTLHSPFIHEHYNNNIKSSRKTLIKSVCVQCMVQSRWHTGAKCWPSSCPCTRIGCEVYTQRRLWSYFFIANKETRKQVRDQNWWQWRACLLWPSKVTLPWDHRLGVSD